MKIAIATGSILLALASSASAQPGMTPPVPVPEPTPLPVGEPLSENVALMLSLGGTIGSWALVIASGNSGNGNEGAAAVAGTVGALGIVLAPSFGHWYAGKILTRGLGLRLVGGTAFFAGALFALGAAFSEGTSNDSDGAAAAALLLTGAGLFIGGTVDDIVTAPGRVRKRNQERGFAIAPLVTPDAGGLSLAGRF